MAFWLLRVMVVLGTMVVVRTKRYVGELRTVSFC